MYKNGTNFKINLPETKVASVADCMAAPAGTCPIRGVVPLEAEKFMPSAIHMISNLRFHKLSIIIFNYESKATLKYKTNFYLVQKQ